MNPSKYIRRNAAELEAAILEDIRTQQPYTFANLLASSRRARRWRIAFNIVGGLLLVALVLAIISDAF